jgi:hypothetical protein
MPARPDRTSSPDPERGGRPSDVCFTPVRVMKWAFVIMLVVAGCDRTPSDSSTTAACGIRKVRAPARTGHAPRSPARRARVTAAPPCPRLAAGRTRRVSFSMQPARRTVARATWKPGAARGHRTPARLCQRRSAWTTATAARSRPPAVRVLRTRAASTYPRQPARVAAASGTRPTAAGRPRSVSSTMGRRAAKATTAVPGWPMAAVYALSTAQTVATTRARMAARCRAVGAELRDRERARPRQRMFEARQQASRG